MKCSKKSFFIIEEPEAHLFPIAQKDVIIETSDRRSAVKCEENKKGDVLENTKKNHVILYKVEGGIIVEELRRNKHDPKTCFRKKLKQ